MNGLPPSAAQRPPQSSVHHAGPLAASKGSPSPSNGVSVGSTASALAARANHPPDAGFAATRLRNRSAGTAAEARGAGADQGQVQRFASNLASVLVEVPQQSQKKSPDEIAAAHARYFENHFRDRAIHSDSLTNYLDSATQSPLLYPPLSKEQKLAVLAGVVRAVCTMGMSREPAMALVKWALKQPDTSLRQDMFRLLGNWAGERGGRAQSHLNNEVKFALELSSWKPNFLQAGRRACLKAYQAGVDNGKPVRLTFHEAMESLFAEGLPRTADAAGRPRPAPDLGAIRRGAQRWILDQSAAAGATPMPPRQALLALQHVIARGLAAAPRQAQGTAQAVAEALVSGVADALGADALAGALAPLLVPSQRESGALPAVGRSLLRGLAQAMPSGSTLPAGPGEGALLARLGHIDGSEGNLRYQTYWEAHPRPVQPDGGRGLEAALSATLPAHLRHHLVSRIQALSPDQGVDLVRIINKATQPGPPVPVSEAERARAAGVLLRYDGTQYTLSLASLEAPPLQPPDPLPADSEPGSISARRQIQAEVAASQNDSEPRNSSPPTDPQGPVTLPSLAPNPDYDPDPP